MKQDTNTACATSAAEGAEKPLDLVVPWTTPELTLAALRAAFRFSSGLDAEIRLLRVQVVPWPLDPRQSPVPVSFLKEQLQRLAAAIPARSDIRLAREFIPGLLSALREHSVVVLATSRRPWRTSSRKIAVTLRKAGYKVVMINA